MNIVELKKSGISFCLPQGLAAAQVVVATLHGQTEKHVVPWRNRERWNQVRREALFLPAWTVSSGPGASDILNEDVVVELVHHSHQDHFRVSRCAY